MAVQPCSECGNPISTKAAACPHCGAPVETVEVGEVACDECGSTVDAKASACPHCGAPVETGEAASVTAPAAAQSEEPADLMEPLPRSLREATTEGFFTGKMGVKETLFGLVIAGVVIALLSGIISIPSSVSSIFSISGADAPQLPAEQVAFEALAKQCHESYQAADNDIQRSAAFNECRRTRVEYFERTGGTLAGFVGTMSGLSTNQGGDRASVRIRSAGNRSVQYVTVNNQLTDVRFNSMVRVGTPVYDQLAQIEDGALVRFDAQLIMSRGQVYEMSLTEAGTTRAPDFIVRITNVERYAPVATPIQASRVPEVSPPATAPPTEARSQARPEDVRAAIDAGWASGREVIEAQEAAEREREAEERRTQAEQRAAAREAEAQRLEAAAEQRVREAQRAHRTASPPSAAAATAASIAATENPEYRRNNPPRYPPAAARRGIEGEVILLVTVGVDGSPVDIRIHSSSRNRDLDRAAIDAVRRWMFNPRTVDGVRAQGEVLVPINFSMD